MNNFSPSTDTSVGTKRFTAQEVQLAYTLMAVEYMKTPYQEHQLSGLGFSSTMRNSVIVKVDGTFSRTLKVNF